MNFLLQLRHLLVINFCCFYSYIVLLSAGAVVSGSLSTLTGPNERMVDLGGGKTVKVNVIRGADGLEKGEYFDPASNMKFTIQLHGDPITTQTSTKVRSTSVIITMLLNSFLSFSKYNRWN